MSYRVLYRKYRPDSFENLIGQKPIVDILKNSIIDNKIAHAYLFSGPRGTGKTSTARILAKAINCLNNKDGSACGECDNCLAFNGNPDIIEIDAASNNGVDEIRELINNVKIMPTSLKYKVYIIDEVHMLSQSAFNALLLTLEEPPAHVVFILATTNIESVPITILSRCQRFDFKKISEEDILKQMEDICKNEGILYDVEGLREIAILSDGGLRDALSVLDQVSKNASKITADLVIKEVGSISNKNIADLVAAIDEFDYKTVDQIISNFQESNLNYKVVIKKLVMELAKKAVDILQNGSSGNLTYDRVKKMVLELNDLMNKININIDPYLLIKVLLLDYVNVDKKNKEIKNEQKVETNTDIDDKTEEIIEISENKNLEIKEKVPESKPKKENKEQSNLEKLIDIRINNCFVEASKKYLGDIQEKWANFITDLSSALIRGLVSDTKVVTASNKYAIIMTMIKHKDKEINEKLDEVINLFNEYINDKYTLVFIDEAKWNLEKEKYINNLKNKHKYEYIEETIKNTSPKSDINDIIGDVFDIEKVEIE